VVKLVGGPILKRVVPVVAGAVVVGIVAWRVRRLFK
jgi:hypothetical protein